MPLLFEHSLYTIKIVKISGVELPGRGDLLINKPELFDGQEDSQVVVRAVEFVRITLSQM